MNLITTSIAALGRLTLAAAFIDPSPVQVTSYSKNGESSSEKEAGNVLKAQGSVPLTFLNTVLALSWLSERKTLTSAPLAQDARTAVNVKDALIAGVIITNGAKMIVQSKMHRTYPDGMHLTAQGDVPPEVLSTRADAYLRFFRAIGFLNRACVAGAVAATPFINFALFNEYRPHPLRSFFSL